MVSWRGYLILQGGGEDVLAGAGHGVKFCGVTLQPLLLHPFNKRDKTFPLEKRERERLSKNSVSPSV